MVGSFSSTFVVKTSQILAKLLTVLDCMRRTCLMRTSTTLYAGPSNGQWFATWDVELCWWQQHSGQLLPWCLVAVSFLWFFWGEHVEEASQMTKEGTSSVAVLGLSSNNWHSHTANINCNINRENVRDCIHRSSEVLSPGVPPHSLQQGLWHSKWVVFVPCLGNRFLPLGPRKNQENSTNRISPLLLVDLIWP